VLEREGRTVRIIYGSTFCKQEPEVEVAEAEGSVSIRVDRGVYARNCGDTLTPYLIEITFNSSLDDEPIEVRGHGGRVERLGK
jgi:hypothetical protein